MFNPTLPHCQIPSTLEPMADARLTQKFVRELSKLNRAQLEAVETIEGPVMVVAGPGTGKTQVVTMRIANILANTQLNPRNILALTFTEAGVTAMKERLESLVGPVAHQVSISTFHGFANELISTFAYAFPNIIKQAPLSELERYQIIERIIVGNQSLKLLRPPRLANYYVKAIGQALKTLKNETVTPTKLARIARQKLSEIDPETSSANRILAERRAGINLELAGVFASYKKALKELGAYDYEDIILLAIKALEKNTEIRAYYQERFQYIMVDEYQDTNNAQNKLVELLAEFFDRPNLCVVGDDKQAVYRFQGASMANLRAFIPRYKDLNLISLQDNYRSTEPILAAAGDLIANNSRQLANYYSQIGQKLTARNTTKSAKAIRLVDCPNPLSEDYFLVSRLKKLASGGLSFEEMAILCRRNREVNHYRELLCRYDIPIRTADQINLLTEPLINQLNNLLRAVADPLDNQLVLAGLRSLAGPAKIIDLLKLSRGLGKSRRSLAELVRERVTPLALRPFKREITQILDWHRGQSERTLPELAQEIIGRVFSSPHSPAIRINLLAGYLSTLNQFSSSHPLAKLTDWLEYLRSLDSYQLPLPVPSIQNQTDGVFVSTVHGAKGLEFEAVFMADTDESSWNDRPQGPLIKLPSELINQSNWEDEPTEDERRLFYVALTRAKRQLYLSFSATHQDGRANLPCQFVDEIKSRLKETVPSLVPSKVAGFSRASLSPTPKDAVARAEIVFAREIIAKATLSFTDFHTYEICPRQYYLKAILNFPASPNFSLVYGRAIHKALELFFRQYYQTKKLPAKDSLLKFFTENLGRELNEVDSRVALNKGRQILNQYFDRFSPSWVRPLGVEYDFKSRHILLKDIWLTGRLDRFEPIDPIARTIRVYDYKTGSRAKTLGQIEGTTKDSDGGIKEQLIFYALLAKLDKSFPYLIREFVVSFIDDQAKFTTHTIKITAEEIETLQKKIIAAYHEMLSRSDFLHTRKEFDKGCEICRLF